MERSVYDFSLEVPLLEEVDEPEADQSSEAKRSGEPEAPEERGETASVADLGRGGAQHQAIQQRLKVKTEELGFRVVVEKEILEGKGSVDLVLERGEQVFACEVTITTTIDHEIANIRKCLKAGFPMIVVIEISDERLRKMKLAVENSLGKEVAGRVSYFLPDDFVQHLRDLPEAEAASPVAKTRRGYPTRRSLSRSDPGLLSFGLLPYQQLAGKLQRPAGQGLGGAARQHDLSPQSQNLRACFDLRTSSLLNDPRFAVPVPPRGQH